MQVTCLHASSTARSSAFLSGSFNFVFSQSSSVKPKMTCNLNNRDLNRLQVELSSGTRELKYVLLVITCTPRDKRVRSLFVPCDMCDVCSSL